MHSIQISVTSLSEFVSRSGNIASGSYGSVSGIEGTRLHQRIFKDLKEQYGDLITTETSLKSTYTYGEDIELEVSGRSDAILMEDADIPHIIEIKSFNSAKNSFDRLLRPEHMAQLQLYAALYFLNNPEIDCIDITLRYVSITSLEAFEDTDSIKRDEALKIYEEHCEAYIEFIEELINYDNSMVNSIKNMRFPYPNIRPGQSEFMKQALNSLCCKEALFALAPTGTGKTISTLYPAIKGLLKGQYDKIFYLTAKTATRTVACKAINDMRAQGLIIRSILLQSKEQMCPFHKKCDSKGCKYSEGYYGRVKPALSEILTHDDITPELCFSIATKYTICPHEFMLDTLNYCNVVIGDYNHAFDPRVSLIRCFSEEADCRNAVLIDEAHNLVDRAREMYSAELRHSLLKDMMRVYKGKSPRVESFLARLNNYYTTADSNFISGTSVFKELEHTDEKKLLKTKDWEGMRLMPKEFYTLLWKCIRLLSMELDDIPKGETREIAMQFFFESRFFLTVFEQEFNESYICCCYREQDDIVMRLSCLDSSEKLDAQIKDKMPVIFFSATMSPYEYYRNVLIGKNADYCRSLELPSPFPAENLEVIIDSDISTTYANRDATLPLLCDKIVKELGNRHGNYMIFFPSFEYMNKTCSRLKEIFSKDIHVKHILIEQKPSMTNTEKEEFLNAFSEASEDCLIGAAVLGGHFGEGIDLVGDRLSGVVIVGVGLPKLTPERQILSNYYSEKFGDGFAFAYRFPGWEKVLQAVGRVIRTEEDTGFALLIDERLDKPEYLSLYPDNWKI
ncbi:MAG: ATP-dependent DNA helicase [Saccharofermentans sp.]|nr:ATP-dependent DNA helicase [Saccharofermentans sp.]